MIFASVGTEKFPFDRLIKALDDARQRGELEEEVFIQIGCSSYEPRHCIWESFVEFGRQIEFLKTARVIVTHAGVGSFLMCVSLGKVPILFPRLHRYREHLDDHQLEFAKRIDSERSAIVAYNEHELLMAIRHYGRLVRNLRSDSTARPRLADYLQNLLMRE